MTAKDYQNGKIDGGNRREAENAGRISIIGELITGPSHYHPEKATDKSDYNDGFNHGRTGRAPPNR